MITKITLETTVEEILEVLEFMKKNEGRSYHLRLWDDFSFDFADNDNDWICSHLNFSAYIEEHTQPKPTVEKFLSLSDDEFSEYVYKILDDPKKSEILFDAIKEVLR